MKYKILSQYFSLLKKIKLVVFDCDGVMTDGGIYINNMGESFRRFDVKDGLAIKLLQSQDIFLACISGSNSKIIDIRFKSLGVEIIQKGVKDKSLELEKIKFTLGVNKEETMFLGDDINDLKILNNVGIFAVPSDAHEACKKKATLIGYKKGGKGFFREISDNLLLAKGLDPFKSFASKNDYDL